MVLVALLVLTLQRLFALVSLAILQRSHLVLVLLADPFALAVVGRVPLLFLVASLNVGAFLRVPSRNLGALLRMPD